MPEWHSEYCYYDKHRLHSESPVEFYSSRLSRFYANRPKSDIVPTFDYTLVSEFVYLTHDRPKYFLPKHLATLLSKSNISGDLLAQELRMPYDSFSVVLEKDFRVCPGVELKSVRLSRLRSKMALADARRVLTAQTDRRAVETLLDLCANTYTIDIVCDSELEVRTATTTSKTWQAWYFKLPGEVTLDKVQKVLEMYGEQLSRSTSPHSSKLAPNVAHLVAAILLRWSCRPETVVPFTMPRSQRYQHKGNREAFRLFTYPWQKQIRPEGEAAIEELGGRAKVRAHVRGFVYRTLRDERYRRNEDGSYRVVEVEPCIIHPEEYEEGKHAAGD